jgi:prepilin-type N-terminal cleavage/methylation domain-containing protein
VIMKKPFSDKGFTMVEILISLVVIGIGLWAVFDLFHTDAKVISRDEARYRSILIAQSINACFERTGIPQNAGSPQSMRPEFGVGNCAGFQWEILKPADNTSTLRILHSSGQVMDFPVIAKGEIP